MKRRKDIPLNRRPARNVYRELADQIEPPYYQWWDVKIHPDRLRAAAKALRIAGQKPRGTAQFHEEILQLGGHRPGDINVIQKFRVAARMTPYELADFLDINYDKAKKLANGSLKEKLTTGAVKLMTERLLLQKEFLDEILDELAAWKPPWR